MDGDAYEARQSDWRDLSLKSLTTLLNGFTPSLAWSLIVLKDSQQLSIGVFP